MDNSKEKYTWDLSLLSDKEINFKNEKEVIKEKVDSFVERWEESDFLIDAETLGEALDDYEKLMVNFGTSGKAGYYYFLKRSLNQSDSNLKAKQKKVEEFSQKQENRLRFFTLRISKTDEKKQKEFLNSPLLTDYKNFLKKLFRKGEYSLSQKEERILSLKSGPAYSNWVDMVNRFLAEEERVILTPGGKKETKSFSEITSLINDKDKKVRDSAAEAFNEILDKNSKIAEVELNSVLENKKVNDWLRGFSKPEESRYISDDVEEETVNNLVEAVTDNFQIARDYYKLKANLFGVEKLKYHERNVPYGDLTADYSFKEAKELVGEVLGDLDGQFLDIFNKFLDGRIDLRPKKGKRGGGFCIHNLITQPVYILLNYTDKLEDVLTLIHEAGHGINNELMREEQNSLNFGVSTFTAEVASTFFEDFVTEEIKRRSGRDLKLAILMNKLNRDISTIHRQVAAVNFERDLHNRFRDKGYLSKEEVGMLFKSHMEAYMGDFVEQSDGSQNWWVYWSHIRRFFYNYSYAGGLLISKSLQSKVKESPGYVKEVKTFLKAGTSKSPKEIFKEMGLNIQSKDFWSRGLKETENLLKEAESLT